MLAFYRAAFSCTRAGVRNTSRAASVVVEWWAVTALTLRHARCCSEVYSDWKQSTCFVNGYAAIVSKCCCATQWRSPSMTLRRCSHALLNFFDQRSRRTVKFPDINRRRNQTIDHDHCGNRFCRREVHVAALLMRNVYRPEPQAC